MGNYNSLSTWLQVEEQHRLFFRYHFGPRCSLGICQMLRGCVRSGRSVSYLGQLRWVLHAGLCVGAPRGTTVRVAQAQGGRTCGVEYKRPVTSCWTTAALPGMSLASTGTSRCMACRRGRERERGTRFSQDHIQGCYLL